MVRSINGFLYEISELARYKELLRNLVVRSLKVRYKRSFLGFLWVMLNPLLMMLILSMVFSEIFKVSTKDYTIYILSGTILWNFFSQSTSASVHSFLGNSNLIKKVYMPRAIFPLSIVAAALVNFIFSLIPLFIICLINGTSINYNIYLLPVGIILLLVFSFGIALVLSTLTVFFHDTIYIYEVLLMAWMYITPVFYPESIVPHKFSFIIHLNPLYYFLSIFRGALYMDIPAMAEKILYAFIFSVASLLIGWFIYYLNKDRVVYCL